MSWLDKFFGLEKKKDSSNVATISKPIETDKFYPSFNSEEVKKINEANFYFWRKDISESIPGTLDKRVTKDVFGARIQPSYIKKSYEKISPFFGPIVEDENKEIFWGKIADVIKNMDLRQHEYGDFQPKYFDTYKAKYPQATSLKIHRVGLVKAVCYVKDEIDSTLLHGCLRWHTCAEIEFLDENNQKLHEYTVMATLSLGLTIEDALDGIRKFEELIAPEMI